MELDMVKTEAQDFDLNMGNNNNGGNMKGRKRYLSGAYGSGVGLPTQKKLKNGSGSSTGDQSSPSPFGGVYPPMNAMDNNNGNMSSSTDSDEMTSGGQSVKKSGLSNNIISMIPPFKSKNQQQQQQQLSMQQQQQTVMQQQQQHPNQQHQRQHQSLGKTHAPWWTLRIQELSTLFETSTCTETSQNLSWVSKVQHHPVESCAAHVEHGSCTCCGEKVTKRSKKVIPDDKLLVCRKIRIKPSETQKKLFQRWFGITRFTYNEALRLIDEGWKPSWKPLKMYLLNQQKNTDAHKYPWLFDNGICPCDAKISAVHELCSAIAATKESIKARGMNPNNFTMKKRKKKDLCQRVHIDVNGGRPSIRWTKNGFSFWSSKGTGHVKPYHKRELNRLPGNECHSRATIKYESPGKYYLLIPILIDKKTRNTMKQSAIAFDPGVRTFQTGFNNKGQFVEYGKREIGKLFTLGKKMDKIQSKIDRHYKSFYSSVQERVQFKTQRRRWRKQVGRLRHRVRTSKRTCIGSWQGTFLKRMIIF